MSDSWPCVSESRLKNPTRTRHLTRTSLTWLSFRRTAGAALGGWYFANRMKEETAEVAFHRLTFRRGEVRTARFAPDGDTIVYSAAWDGNPSEIFVANRRSPEARPLGVVDADVLAVDLPVFFAAVRHRYLLPPPRAVEGAEALQY